MKKRPKFPDDYIGERSEKYNNTKWMERNQKKTTATCIQYLFDPKLGIKDIDRNESYLILDLGCGTGFSSEVMINEGFRVVGIDILENMLYKGFKKKKGMTNNPMIEFILADINQLPIRINSINHIISVSAYNFILQKLNKLEERLKIANETARYLNKILKKNGRIVIEFYPQDENELNYFTSSFLKNDFIGYIIKKFSNQKSGQTFLLLKKL